MFETAVAWKHITSNPRMVLFTVLAVALAVAVIVVMMGIMEGYRVDIVTSTVENSPHLTVGPKEDEDYIYLYKTLSETIRSYPGVVAVSPRLLGKAGARYRDEVRSVSFIGASPVQEDLTMRVREDMVSGDYFDLIFEKRSAVLGTDLADELEIGVGDDIELIRQNTTLNLIVAGLIETGTASDQTLVYLPLETAQDLVGEGDVVSQIGVRLTDIYAAPALASYLNERTDYDAQSWQDQSRDVLELLETQRIILYFFYALVFAIAGFGVANTMIMTVKRRTREIGILMAMGASRASITVIFLMESLILGPPAAALGCILAYAAAKMIEAYPIELPSEIYMVSRMNVYLTPEIFAYAVIFALIVNLIAGFFPAYKASRLDPVEAIGAE